MKTKRKAGDALIISGLALVLLATILLMYNIDSDGDANKASSKVMTQLTEEIAGRKQEYKANMPRTEDEAREHQAQRVQEMDVVFIDGVAYVGYISIPALGVDLPVIATWNYDYLKQSPCRYMGTAQGKNLVVCAHNYTSHFGRLPRLSKDDTISFTDVNGNETFYSVSEAEILAPAEIEEMIHSDYDLTLFTCTYGGRTRYTVRCLINGTK